MEKKTLKNQIGKFWRLKKFKLYFLHKGYLNQELFPFDTFQKHKNIFTSDINKLRIKIL